MKKNESIGTGPNIKIIDLNSEAHAVAKINGKTIFIEPMKVNTFSKSNTENQLLQDEHYGALPDEIIDCKIIADKKNFFLGELISINTKSTKRIKPQCPIFGLCGGCSLQHLSYDAQLAFKQNLVLQNLKRLGSVNQIENNIKIENIIGMENPWQYRNKAEFPIGSIFDSTFNLTADSKTDSQNLHAGFYKKKTHEIISTENCLIQNTLSNTARLVLKDLFPKLCHLVTRVSKNNSLMLILVTADLRFFNTIKTNTNSSIKQSFTDESFTAKSFTEKCSALQKAIPELTSLYLSYSPNASHSNGKDFIHLFGDAFLIDSIGSLSFEISPQSFFQTNHIQTEQLYKIVKQYASLSGNETVVDLYCGIGTIGLYLASHAQKIIGVESVKEAVENAKANAKRNSIPNAQFIHSRAEHALEKITEPIDLLIVDPPRAGLEEKLIKEIIKKNPKKIIYVSCNPASFSRDIKRLREKSSENYSLTKLQAIDMFPHTTHVETVVLITRKND
ncbi:MAG TPA: 23S rRNA (uracil(1939)-C(5))-methyltransferase RlmD [Treponemataceae bacterium]|nr:23S rRNA (uracil(1939)-C(5))-methyltransferase RlmD [Treponemataceae bacterium]